MLDNKYSQRKEETKCVCFSHILYFSPLPTPFQEKRKNNFDQKKQNPKTYLRLMFLFLWGFNFFPFLLLETPMKVLFRYSITL